MGIEWIRSILTIASEGRIRDCKTGNERKNKNGTPHKRSWQRQCGKGNEYARSWPLRRTQGPVNPANQEFGVHGEKSYFHPLPSFSAKAGNQEIQAVKKKQTHPAQCSLLPTYLSEPDASATVVLIPSSVISISWKTPKPRICTAKTQSTLRSSRQVRISCLPLRSLRLRGENAFQQLRSTRHLATLISCLGYSALGVFSDDYLLPSLTLPAQKTYHRLHFRLRKTFMHTA